MGVCRPNLPPFITASSSRLISSLPYCQVMNSDSDRKIPPSFETKVPNKRVCCYKDPYKLEFEFPEIIGTHQ
jgi:hypothetical protein